MAFASTRVKTWSNGYGRTSVGTFTNASTDTGGTIDTGLKHVWSFKATPTSHVGAESPKVTLNSPSPGNVTLVISEDCDGVWEASGRV